jgi:hypothetical protein
MNNIEFIYSKLLRQIYLKANPPIDLGDGKRHDYRDCYLSVDDCDQIVDGFLKKYPKLERRDKEIIKNSVTLNSPRTVKKNKGEVK